MRFECRVVEDPEDPLVRPAAQLADRYWQEALGASEPGRPPSELAWQLTPAGGRRWARLIVVTDRDALLAAALQQLGWEGQQSSWLAWAIVAEEARRRGVGRRLLEAAADLARGDGRVRLEWNAPVQRDDADAFSVAAGARRMAVVEQNRVATAALDRSMLEAWSGTAQTSAAHYELVGWDHACPDHYLEAFTELGAVMDDAPGNRPSEGRSSSRTRLADTRALLRGPYWRLCARRRGDGAFAGYTELQPPDGPPWVARQGDTGVLPAHRGRGLGRWLKAVNALRLLDERPEAQAIETFNAEGNGPMLSINRAMGFRVVCRWQQWSRPV